MIRQGAFAKQGGMLKGGLNCHTTRSDGHGSPEAVIRLHAEMGYDFLAITDHRIYNYQNYAPETGLTILPGMEMDRGITSGAGMCFHTVAIGPAREDGNGFLQDQRFESGEVADQYAFQSLLDELHANGNMTIYCHPDWSCTPARAYERMRGNFAMEIWNSGCAIENDMDTNALGWDELLVGGSRIFGVATDDGHAMSHHGHGWVMVRAENRIDAILAALGRGDFYSSCGPEIYDFSIDGDIARLECSPAASICFINGVRPNRLVRADDAPITRAQAQLHPAAKYLRATVVDAAGRRAWTNPIFLHDAPNAAEGRSE
jgi:hypothetical protein